MVKMEASMSDEKIAVTKQAKAIHSIVAIEKLALNMGRMAKELEKQEEHLGKLESEPASRMKLIKIALPHRSTLIHTQLFEK